MPPATITGSLHPSNKEAIAWNERGIIAFGCHSTLVFFDVRRLEVFQTLEQHSTAINSICWKAPSPLLQGEKESSKESSPKLDLKCASSDISGNIFVWDVIGGNVCASFRNATTPVNDLKWFNWLDPDREMLLSLHANTWAILWDIGKKERIWEYKFTMPAFKASIDCFDASRMAFSSSGATLLFLQDLSPQRCSPTDSSISAITLEPRTSVSLNKTTESAIVQLKHHAAFPQLLFVLFPSEICLVETQHKQIIYSAIVDAGSPLVQMLPCARRDAIFLVHQNGLVSFRLANFHFSDERVSASLDYERKCFAESLHRQSARLRVVGAALCPATNSTVAMLMNSGRLLIYQLENVGQSIEPYRIRSLTDFVQLDDQCQSKCVGPLRLTQYGCYSPLTSTITIVRVRPISVDSSTEDQQKVVDTASPTPPPPPTDLDRIGQLAAIGSSTGNVHLVNVFTGQLVRALQVHTFPVKCLEWAGHNAIVSSAYIASLSSSNTVRNDLFITDIRTGVKRRIRPEQEESPIEAIRVSHYSSYLAISFRHHPLEIWDLGTQRLLRRMNKRCPVIVDMCWSGKHHQAKLISERTRIFRENLVVLDNDNHLYHVVVKGLHVRDGKEVSTQWKSGAAFLRCMVWKDDVLAFGDSAGRIGVWDLAKSQCRQSGLSQSTRGPVQRIVFSKLTGDYTLVAQHPTSLVVWDTEKLNAVFSLQKPGLSMIDVDMCGLTPVYISSDGMFRIALSENNEKERHFPLTMGDLDTPLLLQSSELEFPELIKDDPDFEEIQSRLTEFRGESSQLNQLAFQHQFKGDLALADFCRVVENVCRRRKMAASNESQKLDEQLPTDLLLLWSKEAYATRMELMTRLLLSTCRSEGQLEQAIENCIIMKKNELATYYLLNNEQQQETPIASREEIRLNAFRACVLSTNYDSEEAKCLVKLTATNLIASNFVSEGIQLLSLIDQGLDACKYLISQGFWKRSLAYAKMNPNCDFVEIYQRYAEHLATESVGLKSLALLVLASLGNWERCRALAKTNRQSKLIEQILDETKDEIPNDG